MLVVAVAAGAAAAPVPPGVADPHSRTSALKPCLAGIASDVTAVLLIIISTFFFNLHSTLPLECINRITKNRWPWKTAD